MPRRETAKEKKQKRPIRIISLVAFVIIGLISAYMFITGIISIFFTSQVDAQTEALSELLGIDVGAGIPLNIIPIISTIFWGFLLGLSILIVIRMNKKLR
jgi:hypothetical protein